MSHAFFISVSYIVSLGGLFVLAVKTYRDMKQADKAAANMRRARRTRGDS